MCKFDIPDTTNGVTNVFATIMPTENVTLIAAVIQVTITALCRPSFSTSPPNTITSTSTGSFEAPIGHGTDMDYRRYPIARRSSFRRAVPCNAIAATTACGVYLSPKIPTVPSSALATTP